MSNEEGWEIVTYREGGSLKMFITLQAVQESEKEILRNLYALYLHDLSKFTPNITIGANGFFEYEDLHMFWENDGITPYFIKSDNEIVGFLLLLERPFLKKENDFGINDIFILNQYKGKGIGKQVIESLLKRETRTIFRYRTCRKMYQPFLFGRKYIGN